MGLSGGSNGKASAYNAGDPGSIPGSGRSPGEGNGNPLHILASPAPKKGLKEISDTNCRIVRLCQEPLKPPPTVMIA